MTEAFRLIRTGDHVPGLEPDLRWAWLTLTLSALVATGYVIIAFNWYFQNKVAGRLVTGAAVRRLNCIVLCCGVLGAWFFVSDMFWAAWRAYDVVLVLLAFYTWSFAVRMRGVGLVNDRLARFGELESSANRYREIAELLPHVVWTATEDGRIDFSNRRWAEFAGEASSWFDAVPPDEGQ